MEEGSKFIHHHTITTVRWIVWWWTFVIMPTFFKLSVSAAQQQHSSWFVDVSASKISAPISTGAATVLPGQIKGNAYENGIILDSFPTFFFFFSCVFES
jgi:hypothetical protein